MFRYYQRDKTSSWEYVLDTPEALAELTDQQVPMLSVLAVKDPIATDEDKYNTPYKGSFYVDIDCDKIEEAITSAQRLNDKLIENKVSCHTIFLSGKKGFHFILPMDCFANLRPVKHLPLIYKEMALELFVEGVDLKVYNEGKPRLLRTPNVKRADNGQYKVSISSEELYVLDKEKYASLCSEPRPLISGSAVTKSVKLTTMYEACKSKVAKKLRSQKNVEFEPLEQIKLTLGKGEELPECINKLIKEGDTKPSSNFNMATMVFANYMVAAGVKDWITYANQMAQNVKSSSYNTPLKRLLELKKMMNYYSSSPKFAKSYLFGTIEPCGNCAVCNGSSEAEEANSLEGDVESYQDKFVSDLTETPNGYTTGEGKNIKRITNFTLDLISKFTESSEDSEFGETRVGVNAWVMKNGKRCQKVSILEDTWMSSKEFKSTFKGKSNLIFLGGDTDVQKIGGHLMSKSEDLHEVCYVHSVGMHRHKVGDKTLFVYVEPSFSVSSIKEKDTHEVWGNIPAPPNVRDAKYPEANDELKTFVKNMFECNSEEVTASVVSWMALCHIKVQLTMRTNQFPILNLWGNAGGGKTTVSSLFAALHGVDYMLEHSPLSLQGSTPWSVAQYCTNSESTPRLIEEFNVGEIANSKYDSFSGLIKAAWNRQTFAKGGIEHHKGNSGGKSSGARVIEAKISSPLVVMSEQAPERPALRQRMIQLNVNIDGREQLGAEDAMYYLQENKDMFYSLARAMVWRSLETHPDTVAKMMKSYESKVPREIDARPKYAYQTLLVGAEFFCDTLETIGMNKSFCEETKEWMQQSIITNLLESVDKIRIEKLTTEVVLVLQEMAVQASAAKSYNPPQGAMVPAEDYIMDSNHMYINIKTAHSKYVRWSKGVGKKVILTSSGQFETLLKQEKFFITMVPHIDINSGKTLCAKLDTNILGDRGIPLELFESEDDIT